MFREVVGHFASGVTVITTVDGGRRFGTTASAFSSLSVEPPMVLIALNKSSETGAAITASQIFAVNILAEDQVAAAHRFARKGDTKFEGVATRSGELDVPLIVGALAALECRVASEAHGGTHTVFLAEVVDAHAKIGTPLAYWRGRFGRLQLAEIGGETKTEAALDGLEALGGIVVGAALVGRPSPDLAGAEAVLDEIAAAAEKPVGASHQVAAQRRFEAAVVTASGIDRLGEAYLAVDLPALPDSGNGDLPVGDLLRLDRKLIETRRSGDVDGLRVAIERRTELLSELFRAQLSSESD
jgi:flavin reductase (DIM6/NTAB) family NADH-FMN oxidoreductase RutF